MPPTLITLRQVSEDEAEELATLRVHAMRESLEQLGRFEPKRARERFLSGFSPLHTQNVLAGEVKVGFVVVRQVGQELLLDHLYVHPMHQGQGIGSHVLSIILSEADRQGKTVRVRALKQSRSNGFYIEHGFQLTGQSEWDNDYVRYPQHAV